MNQILPTLVKALVQIGLAIVGMLAVFGVNISPDVVNAIGANLEQLLGGAVLVATLLPSMKALWDKLVAGDPQ